MADTSPMLACGCRAYATMETPEGPVPSCIVHGCVEQVPEPDLTGRVARCSCGKERPSVDRDHLAFFEYHGPGSMNALHRCGVCRYFDEAHGDKPCERCKGTGVASNGRSNCPRCVGTGLRYAPPQTVGHVFVPIGDQPDSFYCGHGGWD